MVELQDGALHADADESIAYVLSQFAERTLQFNLGSCHVDTLSFPGRQAAQGRRSAQGGDFFDYTRIPGAGPCGSPGEAGK
jgi:hypothetical protein